MYRPSFLHDEKCFLGGGVYLNIMLHYFFFLTLFPEFLCIYNAPTFLYRGFEKHKDHKDDREKEILK